MKRLYGKEWHNILFESFANMSSVKIADTSFYSSFYREFFKKYEMPEDIDPAWMEFKLQAAEFLRNHRNFKKEEAILSIGCGLGVMEKALIEAGYGNLEITEISKEPLKWILPHIPPDKVHIGRFPDCIPSNRRYGLIYLSGVEYCFEQDELVKLLKAVAGRLTPGGVCLMMSASFEFKSLEQKSHIAYTIKSLIKYILEKAGLRKRGQFLGYARNRKDFFDAVDAAGLADIEDGILEKKGQWRTYWIKGVRRDMSKAAYL